MVNVANPNAKSRKHIGTRRASSRKLARKNALKPKSREARADTTRGARPGLLPTSGPRAALSKKKQRKLEKMAKHALKRKLEAAGEVVMQDAAAVKEPAKGAKEDTMEVDAEIS
ncbi:uncharacterized protein DNG_01780 [Cephalotrichum gorgonifer]|uniref:Uncharacterized protein n=1 Tax=Cephalotrichum gorgonifer TaxID=2041049 RepID=A0AAE8SSK3_9PEZI|nr:uncharacterized protein DNG_01780 [Cephalotrichum gorgonifer]